MHKLWSIVIGCLLLTGGFFWLTGRGGETGDRRHVVERKPMIMTVVGDGTLESEQSIHIFCPKVSRMWQFTISFMAPEGKSVKAGTPLVRFDDKSLRDRLNLSRAQLATERKNLEKKQLQEKEKLERLTLARAEQEVAVAKLERKLQTPDKLMTRHEIQETRYDLELAKAKLELARTQESNQRKGMGTVIVTQQNTIDRLAGEVANLEESVRAMTVQAPKDGLVVYQGNHGKKAAVGDTVWYGRSLLELPDLNKMRVAAVIDEPDAGKLAVGQPVSIRLDASPELVFKGEIASLGTIFRERSRYRPEIVFDAVVSILDPDPELMRPGMAAKLEITVDRTEPVLQIPEQAVHFESAGAFVNILGKAGKRRVVLGRRSAGFVEVVDGLVEGDTIIVEKAVVEAVS